MIIHQQGRIFHYGLDFGMESWYAEVSQPLRDWDYEYNRDVEEMIPVKYFAIYVYVLYTGDVEIQADSEWEFFPSTFDFTEPQYQVNLAGFPIAGTKLVY